MSIRLEMMQVARLAPKVLGDSTELVKGFLLRQLNEDGGFKDRSGRSDLYYTVFGLEGLMALQANPSLDATTRYLESWGTGESLDFVHLCCLARCRATLERMGAGTMDGGWAEAVSRNLALFRSSDGGFHPTKGAKHSTVYAAFLALAAHQDLRIQTPAPNRLVEAVMACGTSDGGWANEPSIPIGATNSTAAAVTLLRNLSVPVVSAGGDWLMAQCHKQGGFVAFRGAPIPDLLSTATALHALGGMQRSIAAIKDPCLDFVDSLWTNEGGFHGHWDDHHVDTEYTYYGLLALGHLSL